ncbi:hypothetical protein K2173_005572 [Erythroxylum novogranatense]|uniref:Pyruvate dehydrogenase E1 component subunit beta n=1 Tax=Erythroxylum novogranatense TaxID=1862640 RepID=A0AAV8T502_9ROSI|nr:hypothetical protein K2173_005572 [Erythroxylum novogranatense]
MERDPILFVMGEDVGRYKISYKVTKVLAKKYGHNCLNGMSIRANMIGLRPLEAKLVRLGDNGTILAYSRIRYHVMQATKNLVNKGYNPEKTGGLSVVLTEDVIENFHEYLDPPIIHLSSQDVPTPYVGILEEWTVVQPAQIVTVVEQL